MVGEAPGHHLLRLYERAGGGRREEGIVRRRCPGRHEHPGFEATEQQWRRQEEEGQEIEFQAQEIDCNAPMLVDPVACRHLSKIRTTVTWPFLTGSVYHLTTLLSRGGGGIVDIWIYAITALLRLHGVEEGLLLYKSYTDKVYRRHGSEFTKKTQ